jgi:hypothetical protein
MRNGNGKSSTRNSLRRPGVKKIKIRGRNSPSLSLRVRRVIKRNSMTRDKRRYDFLILLSPRKRMSQSGRIIIRKKPGKVYRLSCKRSRERRNSAFSAASLTAGGEFAMGRL